jgi:hypothetical protein
MVYLSPSSAGLGVTGDDSAARDSTNTFTMAWSGQLSADITLSGVGGLDTGTEAANTWYALHVIGDRTQVNPPAAMLSASATAPVLPSGYNGFRRLGWVRNDGASNFLTFTQRGIGRDRNVWYDALNIVLFGGAAVAFTAVGCATVIPPTSRKGYFLAGYNNNSGVATDFFLIRPAGFTSAIPPWIGLQGYVSAATFPTQEIEMPTNASQTVEYLVSNASTSLLLIVQGYTDRI